MIDDLRELNEKFYALYGRLYKNRELLGKAQEDSIAAKLLAQYEAEYGLLHLREEIVRAKELYELRLKSSALTPRTWRSWFFRRKYNRAAALSGERIAAEVERYFARLEEALRAEQASDGEAGEPTDAPDETSENAPETAQDTAAGGNAGETADADHEPKETAQSYGNAEGAGEADLSENPVGAGAATDGGGGARFTAAPTAYGDENVVFGIGSYFFHVQPFRLCK